MSGAPTISWGSPSTVEAPYWMLFTCHNYSKFFQDRSPLNQELASIALLGTIVSRGTMNRYTDDADIVETFPHLRKALGQKAGKIAKGSTLEDTLFGDVTAQAFMDTFGNMQKSAGRLDLVATESVYMGASRRRYQLNWNLKTVSNDANSELAALIGNTFEALSMPSPVLSTGNLIDAITRMNHPPLWQLSAWDARNSSEQTGFWLGQPKPCALVEVAHGIDNSRFYRTENAFYPFSYNIGLTFIEIEGLFRDPDTGGIISRSEMFDSL